MKPTLVLLAGLILWATAAAQQPSDPCASLKEDQKEMESTLRDWPNLAKYRDDNAKLAPPAKGESRVVFLGDSITEFWPLSDSFPGKPYMNHGISGQTTPLILLRFRQDVIALQPKVVVILAGTNDIAENTGPITLAAIEDNLTSWSILPSETASAWFYLRSYPLRIIRGGRTWRWWKRFAL
jgi:hypothetical protein